MVSLALMYMIVDFNPGDPKFCERLVFVFLSKELACQGPKFHESPSSHETSIQIVYSPLPGNSLLYTKAFGSLPPFLVLFCAVCFKASQSQSL